MKVELTEVYRLGLSPNMLYVLLCKRDKLEPKEPINIVLETRLLQSSGFLNDDETLTEKGEYALVKAEYVAKTKSKKFRLTEADEPWIEKYRQIFPADSAIAGRPLRASIRDLIPRFEFFFEKYPDYLDWLLVLEATRKMVNEISQRAPERIYGSKNFIKKEERDRTYVSPLADYCEQILEQRKRGGDNPSGGYGLTKISM